MTLALSSETEGARESDANIINGRDKKQMVWTRRAILDSSYLVHPMQLALEDGITTGSFKKAF